jgi:copper chaperone CopZ
LVSVADLGHSVTDYRTFPHDPQEEPVTQTTYTVTGMTCGHCAAAVTEEVSAVPGVAQVEVSVEAGTVVVRGDGVSEEQVRAAVDEAGYTVV